MLVNQSIYKWLSQVGSFGIKMVMESQRPGKKKVCTTTNIRSISLKKLSPRGEKFS
jgi:hypothetical protein